jgi:integrase
MSSKLNEGRLRSIIKNGEPGKLYGDGAGLYIRPNGSGGGLWIFRYQINRKSDSLSCGSYPAVGLAEARERAGEYRKLARKGSSPRIHREAKRSQRKSDAEKPLTVGELIEKFAKTKSEGGQWSAWTLYSFRNMMNNHVLPRLRDVFITDAPPLIEGVLAPIWKKKPAIAVELRRRLAQLFDYATEVYGIQVANPARFVQKYLGKQKALGHRKSLPYEQMPEFMRKLREFKSKPHPIHRTDLDRAGIIAARAGGMKFREIAQKFGAPHETARYICITGKTKLIDYQLVRARALEFLILIGAPRSIEVLDTRRSEIDRERKILIIPRAPESLKAEGLRHSRMKVKDGRGDHVIPLCSRALEIADEMETITDGDYLFPGSTQGRRLAERKTPEPDRPATAVGLPAARNALNRLLKETLQINVDTHGFRRTFKNWAIANQYREIAINLTLDHAAFDSKTENAYYDDLLIKERHEMLEAWSAYCSGPTAADVIAFPRQRIAR